MSFFSVGGNLGFALGPIFASSLVVAMGLNGGAFLAVPGLLVALALVFVLRYISGFVPAEVKRGDEPVRPAERRGLALLLGVVGLRSIAHMGLFTFVPLWEVHKGHSAAFGTRLLSGFLVAGAIGTLLGGPLADRFGRRPVLRWSFVVAAPLILLYVLMGGVVGDTALVISGAAVIGTFGVSLVMSQEYMPGRVGMASGLSIGLAIGLGGVAALTLGAIADAIDLKTAVLATAAGPALAYLVTLALPPVPRRPVEPAPATL
jgi:FSR family fosmidomycin resistance protein-like MFS transporter